MSKLSLERVGNGILVVVRDAHKTPGLRELCDSLSILPAAGIANRRERLVTSAAELDTVREPLRGMVS